MSRRVAALAASCSAAVLTLVAACSSGAPDSLPPPGAEAETSPASPASAASAPSAAPTTSPWPLSPAGGGWYLALGDSLAAGFQPTTGAQPTRGYAGPVLAALRRSAPGTQLRNLGCSGETTTSMRAGGLCRYPEGSQLAAAVAFLRANAAATRLVTLDIGANNALRCARPAVDQACASAAVSTVAADLSSILGQLRAAAPGVDIVVLTYYNPLLAWWRRAPRDRQAATQSQPLLGALNTVVANAAVAAGAKVADVAGAFATPDNRGSPEPVNVARVCAWTWMCTKDDIHANDAGYAAMAEAVLAAR